jgi:CO dehydrogenase nickel-insertion accessory protein CooC1
MATEAAIPQIGLIGNRVSGTLQEQVIRASAELNGIPVLALIPFDQEVADSGITGALPDEKQSAALREIARFAGDLAAKNQVYADLTKG